MAQDFRSAVESQAATQFELLLGLTFLILALTTMVIQLVFFLRQLRKTGNRVTTGPFNNYFLIYLGLIMVIVNEIVILTTIIISDQQYTVFGREKAIFIVAGLGLFIFGWTRIVLFHLSLKGWVNTAVRFAFAGAMIFYIFALGMTIAITFGLIDNANFVGIGYSASVGIYGTFLIIDLVALGVIAARKRKISKFQAWIGLLLFSALFLNFLSILFNALPLVIVNRVDPDIHAIINYIVEPLVYFVTMTLAFRLIYWILFNPQWLIRRSIDSQS